MHPLVPDMINRSLQLVIDGTKNVKARRLKCLIDEFIGCYPKTSLGLRLCEHPGRGVWFVRPGVWFVRPGAWFVRPRGLVPTAEGFGSYDRGVWFIRPGGLVRTAGGFGSYDSVSFRSFRVGASRKRNVSAALRDGRNATFFFQVKPWLQRLQQ